MNIEEQSIEENIINVLMYLFENHMQSSCKIEADQSVLSLELYQAGFQQESVRKAFNWLSELILQQYDMQQHPPQQTSIRIFDREECFKIDKLCRNLILRLEHEKILCPLTRELVISRIMQLDCDMVSINQVKWVVLMVLFNQPDKRGVMSCMESLVLADVLSGVQEL
jgi:Smg protein